ncbi:MAG: hypothetical protein QG608_1499 [Actinomycetota bacterium]|nr:hypothetical protein [Actinomycetota bacterium]
MAGPDAELLVSSDDSGPGRRIAGVHAWTIGMLFARSRGARNLLLIVALGIVLGAVAPRGWVELPLRQQVVVVLQPLVCGLFGIMLGVLTQAPGSGMEPRRSGRLAVARATWLLLVILLLELLLVATLYGGSGEGVVVSLRAIAVTGGLTLLVARYLPPVVSWAPAFGFLMVSALYGTRDAFATPKPWALLQQYPDDVPAAVVAIVLVTAGAVSYVRAGGSR